VHRLPGPAVAIVVGLVGLELVGCTSRAQAPVPAPDRPPDGTLCGSAVCDNTSQVCCVEADAGVPVCVDVPANCSPGEVACVGSVCPGLYLGCDGPEDCPGQGEWCCLFDNAPSTVEHTACSELVGANGVQCGSYSDAPVCKVTSDCAYLESSETCVNGSVVYGGRDGLAALVSVCK
jgi:hypothetical protein